MPSASATSIPRKRTSSKVVHDDNGNQIGIECRCGKTILLDAEDIVRISKHTFFHDGGSNRRVSTWVYTQLKRTRTPISRLVIDFPAHLVADHINSDIHDNRKSNLRVCTKTENLRNKSKPKHGKTSTYIGVSVVKATDNWVASYRSNNKKVHIGTFKTQLEAAIARDNFVHLEYGGFAKLNFPERFGITYP